MKNLMSAYTAPAQVHIAAPLKKSFSAVKFDSIVSGLVPLADSESVKPSFIKLNKATASAAMGGKASPMSFVTGLLFNVCAFAWGQGKLDTLCDGLPPVAAFAIRAACDGIKGGAGIDAGTLRHAASVAMSAVVSLPTKAKEAKIEAPAIEGTSARVPDVDTSLSASESLALQMSINPDMDNRAALVHGIKAYRLEKEEAAQAAQAMQVAEERAAWLARMAEERMADALTNRAIAIVEFHKLAEFLGVVLTKAQEKALAKAA